MVMLQALAYMGLVLTAITAAEFFGIGKRKSVYFVGLLLCPLLLYRDYYEIYVWYTGAMAYLLPVIFFCFGFSCMLMGELRKKKVYYAFAGVLLFLMSGGVLEFVGLGCWLLLMWVIFEWKRTKKLNVCYATMFLTALAGALINACAPGNFVRQSTSKNGVSLTGAVIWSVKAVLEETEWLYKDTTFLLFALLAFIIGYFLAREIKQSTLVMLIIGFVALPAITIFPIILGIGKISASQMANRYLFLLDASIILCNIGILILLGSFLRGKSLLPEGKSVVWSICLAASVVLTVHDMKIVDYNPVMLTHNIYNHVIADYAEMWKGIYEEIRTSEDSDVIIEREQIPDYETGVFYPKLLEDPTWWVNSEVANCYGKNSVRVLESPASNS